MAAAYTRFLAEVHAVLDERTGMRFDAANLQIAEVGGRHGRTISAEACTPLLPRR